MPSSAATTVTKTPKDKAPASGDGDDGGDKHDFFWTYTEEPHRTRRLAIIKAHPEVILFFLLLRSHSLGPHGFAQWLEGRHGQIHRQC